MPKDINYGIVVMLKRNNIQVLRDRRGAALNASFTEEGLRWTTNKKGQNLYFKKGTYVESFIPKNHQDPFMRMAELTWINKAMHLCKLKKH